MFWGRKEELTTLRRLRSKKTSSLVCILGRRRIGKSALIDQFGKEFGTYISTQGLAPEEKLSNQLQLDHFAEQLSLQLQTRKQHFTDWTEAFYHLAEATNHKETLILLDEVSWMGKHDPLFAAKLKSAWDQYFKKNNKLILIICGSVSTWIEENILKNTSFEGRLSLTINLEGLKLPEIAQFWNTHSYHFGSLEKLLALSVAGGVPKYIEEIVRSETVEKNIIELCFKKEGLLYSEFDKIFNSIFERRKESLEKIVRVALEEKLSTSQIAKKLRRTTDNHLSELIHILELSGFVSKDFYFKPNGTPSALNHIRVKDNYLRFYLKYIEPNKTRIEKGGVTIESLFDLPNFESILGYQFENLILANRELLYPLLGIANRDIVSAAPYAQRTGKKCQIDLLIHTKLDLFFLCEFKCKKVIDASIIKTVQKKINALTLPRRSARKAVLVYEGTIDEQDKAQLEAFFYRLIPFSDLLR